MSWTETSGVASPTDNLKGINFLFILLLNNNLKKIIIILLLLLLLLLIKVTFER